MSRWGYLALFIVEFFVFGDLVYGLHLGEYSFMLIPYIAGGVLVGGLFSLLWVNVLYAFENVDRMIRMAAFLVLPVLTVLKGYSTSPEKWVVFCSAAMVVMATIVVVELSGYRQKMIDDKIDIRLGSLFKFQYRLKKGDSYLKRPRRSFRKPRFYRRLQRRHYRDMY